MSRSGVVGIPTDTDARDLGSLSHNAIKEYFMTIGEHPSNDNIKNVFTAIFEQHFERYALHRFRTRANKVRDNFISFEQERRKTWNKYLPTLVEERMKTEDYVTIVDFYSEQHKTLIDWKTGNKRDLSDDDLRQGKVMEIVLRRNDYPVEKILFVALFPNRVFEIPKVADGFVENEKRKMLESIKIGYYPKRGRFCKWCQWVLDCQLEGCCLWTL